LILRFFPHGKSTQNHTIPSFCLDFDHTSDKSL
jgi:hypothetical protein